MKICIGSDHGGYLLKEDIKKYLIDKGYQVIDYGCNSLESVDYPKYAKLVASDVATKACDFGILVCTTGIGMSITANKQKGVRAALVQNNDMCMLTRKHNNSNVLCLGAKYTSIDDAKNYIDTFLSTEFEGGRHKRRVDAIEEA